ncbi:MAG: hypothetical protein CMO74_10715 [Verrucomicrobiales bacterium]|nr:hypothetical protein [Verrucomicrobiales bacterium]|tara:strand:- start:7431 stop:10859 length:3429 start_codon:yes stop_codon:yes gene_type:complete
MRAAIYIIMLLAMPLWAGTPEAMVLLKANCFSCHNPDKEKGGLDLTTREALVSGGDNGKVLQPGKAAASRLIQVLQPSADPHMPPKGQLSPRAIEALADWVDAGAEWDAELLKDRPRPARDRLAELPVGSGPALALALSPDAGRLAVARGSAVVVYGLEEENKVLETLEGHRDWVQSVAWSGDGKWLATGGYRTVRLWNAEQKLAREITALEGRVTAICFGEDNATVFTADGVAGSSGMVRQWNLSDGAQVAEWRAHDDTVHALALTRDGRRLATGGDDTVAKIWEVKTRKEWARFEAHHGPVYGLAFNGDGAQLATAGGDGDLLIWDLKSRQKLTEIRVHKGGVTGVSWSPDDKTLATSCEDGLARMFTEIKSHDGAQRSSTARERKLTGGEGRLHAVAMSSDAKLVAAAGQNGAVYLWRNNKLAATLELEAAETPKVSRGFVRDVLPILSKAGCNAGSCHAKPDGQSGFKLSVFSYDPRGDWREITGDARGRRVFPALPSESLLIKKAALALPHEGGQRIKPGSASERVLLEWIGQGMVFKGEDEPALAGISVAPATGSYRKGQARALKATARFSDGSQRDITALADFVSNDGEIATVDDSGKVTVGQVNGEGTILVRYMGQVAIARITVPAEEKISEAKYKALSVNNFIDELAHQQFERLGLFPSVLATDAEFLRRASLDAIGRLPTPEEANKFLEDKAADKRARLIERLLVDPAYADHWANKWADLVRPNPDRAGLKSVYILDQWLREAFRDNLPMDRFARAMVAASGSTHRFGPAVVYRDKRTPPELAKIFSQVFLGTRLECARCHNHPNEKWTLTDFHAFSAFFGEIGRKGSGVSPPISGGTEWFFHGGKGSVKHPVTGETLAPKPPDASAPGLADGTDPREALVDWMTAPENPFFARAMVNRVWGAFFGRGLVEPVDDMRASNPPVNAALLDALAKHFVKLKYDQKALIRAVMRSRLYQLSSVPNETNIGDTRNFSRAYRRRLSAEVLLDAVSDVTGVPESFSATWPGARAMETWNFKIGSEFLDAFGRPNSSSDPPCERNTKPTIVQALHMMHAEKLHQKITHTKGRARGLADGDKTASQIVNEIYLAAFSRRPTDKERERVVKFFANHPDGRRVATEDFLWVIINSAEFMFNH